jgi:F-type H+-transporting ATPase subunit epsilon
MQFELLTLTGTKFSGEALQVDLATEEGELGVLPFHENLTAIAKAGPVSISMKNGDKEIYAIFGGLLDVTDNRVRLLADEAEHAQDLVESQIEAALKHAEQLKSAARDKVELARAQELIDRQVVRLGVAKMRRHQGSPRP